MKITKKNIVLILIICIFLLVYSLFNLLQILQAANKEENILQENSVVFAEQDCKILLSEIDPSISSIDLKEQIYDYHIDFSASSKPVTWKTNGLEKVSQNNIPEKFVFFVSSDAFEGCGIRSQNIETEPDFTYEHFKCNSNRDVWLNIRKDENYTFVRSIVKTAQEGIEAVFYYSNVNGYGQNIVDNNYNIIESECQKTTDTF